MNEKRTAVASKALPIKPMALTFLGTIALFFCLKGIWVNEPSEPASTETKPVVVAKRFIDMGKELTIEDVEAKHFPVSIIPDYAISDPEEAVGLTSVSRRWPGQFILLSDVSLLQRYESNIYIYDTRRITLSSTDTNLESQIISIESHGGLSLSKDGITVLESAQVRSVDSATNTIELMVNPASEKLIKNLRKTPPRFEINEPPRRIPDRPGPNAQLYLLTTNDAVFDYNVSSIEIGDKISISKSGKQLLASARVYEHDPIRDKLKILVSNVSATLLDELKFIAPRFQFGQSNENSEQPDVKNASEYFSQLEADKK